MASQVDGRSPLEHDPKELGHEVVCTPIRTASAAMMSTTTAQRSFHEANWGAQCAERSGLLDVDDHAYAFGNFNAHIANQTGARTYSSKHEM